MNYSPTTTQIIILIVMVLWDLVWRGMALWRAGRNNQKNWFIALLIINSIGILPIVYLLTNPNHESYYIKK